MASTDHRVYGDAGLGSVSGVVSSLPAGYTLGEERQEAGVWYRLMYNAGGEQVDQGLICSPFSYRSGVAHAGPYSGTVTTTSDAAHAYGAVVAHNATATTDTYFWGAFRGYPIPLSGGASSHATNTDICVGVDGGVSTFVTAATAGAVGQRNPNAIIGRVIGATTTGTITTDTRSGDVAIDFPRLPGGAV